MTATASRVVFAVFIGVFASSLIFPASGLYDVRDVYVESGSPAVGELVYMEETIDIDENGACQLHLVMNVSSPALSSLYQTALGYVGGIQDLPESVALDGVVMSFDSSLDHVDSGDLTFSGDIPVNSTFCQGVRQEQLLSFGIDITEFDSVTMYEVDDVFFLVEVSASGSFLSDNVDVTGNNWTLCVGPANVNASCDRASFVLTKMSYIQEMLQHQTDSQVYNQTWKTTINLPTTALGSNIMGLVGKNWSADLGGGTCMKAYVTPLHFRSLIVTDELGVTTENITVTEPEELVGSGFICYRIFNIKYGLPFLGLGANVGCVGGIEDFRWGIDLALLKIENYGFGVAFHNSDGVSVVMNGSFSLDFTAQMSLKTSWFKLRRFAASITLEGFLHANFTVSVTGTYENSWEQDIFEIGNASRPYTFWVGPVPVVVRPHFRATAKLFVRVEDTVEISCGVNASGSLKAGVGWKKERGFYHIFDADMQVSKTDPAYSNAVEVEVTPSLGFKPMLLFYEVVGPSVEIEPYATLILVFEGLPPSLTDYNVTVGVNLNVGIAFSGWFKKITKLNDWYPATLWNWVLWTFPTEGSDVAITDLCVPQQAFVGEDLNVSVVVVNIGNSSETVRVDLYYRKGSGSWQPFGWQECILENVDNETGSMKTLFFECGTLGMDRGDYDIWVETSILGGGDDENPADNVRYNVTTLDVENVRADLVSVEPTSVIRGNSVEINVFLKNLGTVDVSAIPVSAYFSDEKTVPISDVWCESTGWVFNLQVNRSQGWTFEWDTAEVEPGTYVIIANVSLLPYELDVEDNDATILGDINRDTIVDIYDALILANAFGHTETSGRYNANADLKGDGFVDIYDAILLATRFYQTWPITVDVY